MNPIYVLCEGKTEQNFVNQILREYLYEKYQIERIYGIMANTSKNAKGGSLSYSRYKNEVKDLLKQEKNTIVTSLIDYYKLHTDFPNYTTIQSTNIQDKTEKVLQLEQSIAKDINHERFLPYIQLHEFEALLFSSINGFDNLVGLNAKNKKQIEEIISSYNNPEYINDGQDTYPSARLENLIQGYRKTLFAEMIIRQSGMNSILERCCRFREWVKRLVEYSNKKF